MMDYVITLSFTLRTLLVYIELGAALGMIHWLYRYLTSNDHPVIVLYPRGVFWGSTLIPTPASGNVPVEALEWIIRAVNIDGHRYTLAIMCKDRKDIKQIKQWLKQELITWVNNGPEGCTGKAVIDRWNFAGFTPGVDPWDIEVEEWADSVLKRIHWVTTIHTTTALIIGSRLRVCTKVTELPSHEELRFAARNHWV